MKFTSKAFNRFLLLKLPSAYITGVRVKEITNTSATIRVKHSWINQNPFQSLYFAVQAMAAELATGVLVLREVSTAKHKISMLVTKQTAEFTKKGRGVIHFKCDQGNGIKEAIEKAIETGEGQTIVLQSKGVNEKGEQISFFTFEWSLKVKK